MNTIQLSKATAAFFRQKGERLYSKSFWSIMLLALTLFFSTLSKAQTTIGGINLGDLPAYHMFFSNGSGDANWQGATKGFIGDMAIDGIEADERTSGSFAYAGTIYTNDATLDAWQDIVDNNPGQAFGSTNQTTLISGLESSLESVFTQINALTVTAGYSSVSSTSLDGLNTQNSINEVYVINVTSGFQVSSQISITGDAGDVFILRWDDDANFSDGYEGQVKFQSGGVIIPLGGLVASNFLHVAGEMKSSGGGSNPPLPYPQGPRDNDGTGALITGGADFNGGGFFTGYWFTTGLPTINPGGEQPYGVNGTFSNGIFVGGWYSKNTNFSMTSGTSGVYVSPNPATLISCNLTATATGTNVSCFGANNGSVSLSTTGGTAPLTYLWSNGATTQNISGLAPGNYSVTVTDDNGCEATSSATITQPSAALSASCSKVDATTNGGSDGSASVVASGGTSPYSYLWSNGATTSSISGLTAGTYTVTVTDNKGCTTQCSAVVGQPACPNPNCFPTTVIKD